MSYEELMEGYEKQESLAQLRRIEALKGLGLSNPMVAYHKCDTTDKFSYKLLVDKKLLLVNYLSKNRGRPS